MMLKMPSKQDNITEPLQIEVINNQGEKVVYNFR